MFLWLFCLDENFYTEQLKVLILRRCGKYYSKVQQKRRFMKGSGGVQLGA